MPTATTIPFQELPQIAKTDRLYATQDPSLTTFFQYPTRINAFADIIKEKEKQPLNRDVLVKILQEQYSHFSEISEKTSENIKFLAKGNAFTVITAHQPSLFTGTLYFIYKIFSTINLSEQLKKAYPNQHFIPTFVIGGEDHDFEEVSSIQLFNKKITWETTEKGSVGMMQTESLQEALAELESVLGTSDNAKSIFQRIKKAYTDHKIYHTATQALLNDLFGKYGLVVLNMNDANLKREFIPQMQREILEQPSKALVEKTQNELNALGFKSQAFPREINLFYLRPQLRERIVKENNTYKVLNTEIAWSEAEILAELHAHPEHFSPNVVLRPLFQEAVLPNLAYVGGGGELAYWLERKSQFQYFGIPFPMLIRRNSLVWIDKGSSEKMQKLGISILDLSGDIDVFVKNYVAKTTENELDLSQEKAALSTIFAQILEKTQKVDSTLEKTVLAEKTKQLQSIDAIEARLLKAEKQKYDTALNQIRSLSQKFYPQGGLQERSENFLSLYLRLSETLFDILLQELDPLREGFLVLEE